jgi:hypothetical protein
MRVMASLTPTARAILSHRVHCVFVQSAISIGWVDEGPSDEFSRIGRGV